MTRSIASIIFGLLVALPLVAQDDEIDDLTFEEVELQDEDVPYFAVGLGPVLSLSFANVTDLNARNAPLGIPEFGTTAVQWGAELFTAIGVVPDVRLGFSYVSGTSRAVSGNTMLLMANGDSVAGKNSAEYNLRNLGIHADYAFVPVKGLAILPGIGLGFGSQTLSTFKSANSRTWDDYTNFASDPDQYSELSRQTVNFLPRLSIEYAFTPFVAIRGQASYTLQMSDGDWRGNRTANVTGVPSSVSMTAFNAQVGLFLGLFN